MRLDKALADLGLGSRAQVKSNIRKGSVKVNGETVCSPDFDVSYGAVFLFDGQEISYPEFEYYLLYKQAGYLTARTDSQKKTVMDQVISKRTYLSPVGRLDYDTEGVLLITNDGALNHYLLAPKNQIEKVYYVEVDSDLPDTAGHVFSQPIEFKDFTSKPGKYEKISDRSARLTIYEGKNHEVKKMFHHIGCEVTYLRRERFKNLTLIGMKPGECRALTKSEIEKLSKK